MAKSFVPATAGLTFAGCGTTVLAVLRRVTAILLIGLLLALGSGVVQHLHEDAHVGDTHHDENTCVLHALLRGPMMTGGWTPLLVCLGLLVAFLTMLTPQPAPQKFFTRLDCRGPPAALLIST
jgi:hypothetical protein